MKMQLLRSGVTAAAYVITALLQAYFLSSRDPRAFSMVPLAPGYTVLLLVAAVATFVLLIHLVAQLFREKSNFFLSMVMLACAIVSVIWTACAFLQWQTDGLRGILVLVGVLTLIRLIQWLGFEPDGLRAFEPPTAASTPDASMLAG